MRRVYLIDTDISGYITGLPALVTACGEYGQATFVPQLEITARNDDGFWEKNNPASPFFGATDLSMYQILVQVDGQTVFSGGIQTIVASAEDYSATITLRTTLQQVIARGCIYATPISVITSTVKGESPASVARNICAFYGIPTDPASFAAAEAIYSANSVYCMAAFVNPDMTVLDALQRVAEIGAARIYAIGDAVAFNVWTPGPVDPLYVFSDNWAVTALAGTTTLWGAPVDEPLQKDGASSYSVRYQGGTSAFGSTVGTTRQIDGGPDQPLRIATAQAAVWIGERWLSYLNAPQSKIRFVVPIDYGKQLPIGCPVSINYSRGHWQSDVGVEIVSVDTGDGLTGKLVGVTK